jgi:hypothetical protein
MNTTLKFDRVVLVKELNDRFKQIGEVFEIANILDDSFLLRDSKTRIALGVVSFEDLEKCFVHEENFKGWTQWTPFVGFDGHSDALYRTNKKKVQVKFLTNKVRAEACCCKDDDFNLGFGIHLAYLRCLNKSRTEQKTELEEKLNMVEHEIIENEAIIKKMVNSLGA